MWLPMKPAPPVTRIFMRDVVPEGRVPGSFPSGGSPSWRTRPGR
jgi:hypothetical protein